MQETIAHYRITSKLGEGGMGAVYRATDTKLGRDVAIKVLPEAFAQNPERMARFAREAQVLASLNHPNIAAIYGIEENALVMELVEGEDLKGPVPVATAIEYARQIAAGLDAAHEKGIVHRDLKPANIKVTPDGVVKLLDFGLAAITTTNTGQDSSATATLSMSQAGVILGTAAYMAPEQARGKPVDKRADIWAFGVVLYEMLAGTMLFGGGETISDSLAAVITKEPDWTTLPKETPPHIRRLLERCLRKDPKMRLRDIGDARMALDEPEAASAAGAVEPRRSWIPWMVAGLCLVLAGITTLLWLRQPTAEFRSMQFSVDAPKDVQFTNPAVNAAISPDGRWLVYGAAPEGATASLWLRPLDSVAARPIPGTEEVIFAAPFWSPDSKSIAFIAGGKLKRVEIAGGAPRVLCDAQNGGNIFGGDWNQDDVILFSGADGLFRVAASGGVPARVTQTDTAGQETGHSYPQFLSGGQRFLYYISSSNAERRGVYGGSLGQPAAQARILATERKALYAPPRGGRPGALLWQREQTLFAQAFDAGNLGLEGEAVPIADDIYSGPSAGGRAAFWVSGGGLLVYRTGSRQQQLVWMSRDGKRLEEIKPADQYGRFSLSADGRALAIDRFTTNNLDVWMFEFTRKVWSRLTSDASSDSYAVLSPDGRQVAFSSTRSGIRQIYRKDTGGGQEEQVTSSPNDKRPLDWSRDGRFLLYEEASPKTKNDVWALPLADIRSPMAVLQEPFNEVNAKFSPDGKWIAYQADESGMAQVYVQGFGSATSGRLQISNSGGASPLWQGNGGLFYVQTGSRAGPFFSGKIMEVQIRTGPKGIEPGAPRELFTTNFSNVANIDGPAYGASGDGQQFLILVPSGVTLPPLTIVSNWQSGWKK